MPNKNTGSQEIYFFQYDGLRPILKLYELTQKKISFLQSYTKKIVYNINYCILYYYLFNRAIRSSTVMARGRQKIR